MEVTLRNRITKGGDDTHLEFGPIVEHSRKLCRFQPDHRNDQNRQDVDEEEVCDDRLLEASFERLDHGHPVNAHVRHVSLHSDQNRSYYPETNRTGRGTHTKSRRNTTTEYAITEDVGRNSALPGSSRVYGKTPKHRRNR